MVEAILKLYLPPLAEELFIKIKEHVKILKLNIGVLLYHVYYIMIVYGQKMAC